MKIRRKVLVSRRWQVNRKSALDSFNPTYFTSYQVPIAAMILKPSFLMKITPAAVGL